MPYLWDVHVVNFIAADCLYKGNCCFVVVQQQWAILSLYLPSTREILAAFSLTGIHALKGSRETCQYLFCFPWTQYGSRNQPIASPHYPRIRPLVIPMLVSEICSGTMQYWTLLKNEHLNELQSCYLPLSVNQHILLWNCCCYQNE